MKLQKDILHEIYLKREWSIRLPPAIILLRVIIFFSLEWAALYSEKPWTLVFLLEIGFLGTAFLYYKVLFLEQNLLGMWIFPSVQAALLFIVKYLHTEIIYCEGYNIWFALSFIIFGITLMQYKFTKIYRYTGKVNAIPIVALFLEMGLMLRILCILNTGYLLPIFLLTFIIEMNRYCYPDLYAWKKQDRLFFDTRLFPRVHYISTSFHSYVGRPFHTVTIRGYLSPKEKEFRNLDYPEREEVVKKEIRNLCSRFKYGRVYITETHKGIINYILSQQDAGLQLKTILYIKSPMKQKIHSTIRQIYGDKWKNKYCDNCLLWKYHKYCNECSLYPDKEEYPMTDNYDLPERTSRDACIWIFYRKKI